MWNIIFVKWLAGWHRKPHTGRSRKKSFSRNIIISRILTPAYFMLCQQKSHDLCRKGDIIWTARFRPVQFRLLPVFLSLLAKRLPKLHYKYCNVDPRYKFTTNPCYRPVTYKSCGAPCTNNQEKPANYKSHSAKTVLEKVVFCQSWPRL